MTNSRSAYIYALITVIFWSTVATAFKIALAHLDVFQLILYSSLVSACVLTNSVLWQGRLREMLLLLRHHWRFSILAAMLNPLLYYVVLFAAYDRLPAQVAQPINYTWAIVLAVMSVLFLRQRVTRHDFVAGGVCYAGVFLIATQGAFDLSGFADLFGLALALGSTLIWASYWILNVRDVRPPELALPINFLLATPLALLVCLVFSDPFAITLRGIGAAAYVGIFEMGLAFLFWSKALRLADNTSRVSNLIFLSPFVSLWLINLVLGEVIHATTWAGLAVIICGLLYQQRQARLANPGDHGVAT